jgi:WD40 repeat protein
LAGAGSTYDEKGFTKHGQARLYDVAGEPVRRRAVLTFDGDRPAGLKQDPSMCSDVVFTPDGRRVVAVAMQKIRIWDVAAGTEQDAFQRSFSCSSDRVAVSPDGRWLAITGPVQVNILDISPPAP